VLVGIAIPADLTPEERLLSAIFGDKGTPLKDASMIMTGERPGRILNVTLRLRPGMGDAIPAGPGRVIERIGARESPQVVVSIAVDQPVEAGDVLLDDIGSEAIVAGIFGGAALRAKAGSQAEPDLVVAPRHPWAPVPGEPSLRTVRVRLRNENLAGTTIRSRATGEYELLTLQPLGGTADGSAQTLVSADYYWLIAHGARHLAYEMYGPRCDYLEWRAQLAGVRASRGKGVELPRTVTRDWASLQDSPSQAVRRWDMLLRSARILPRLDPEQMTLQLMTEDDALSGSRGEINKPETINRRTLKPEKDGLFCEKAFGPVRDWECYCGKYKSVRFEGIVCERCGVEVTRATVRHERLGHIELPVPVVHSWYLHGPARTELAGIIGVSEEEIRAIAYCARGVVTNPGTAPFRHGQVIDLDQWMAIRRGQPSPGPFAATGGEALRFLLQQAAAHQDTAAFEGIVIQKLPVLPAGMRPMEVMSSGTERTYAPNPLYLGVLRNARRLRHLIDWGSPELIVMNERAQLQRAVDRLLDNARQPEPIRGLSGEEVPSLADLLAGQKWAFLRRSLDYSASTLLVTGDTPDPDVAMLPARLAFDLFEPLIVSAMVQSGAAPDLASAQEHVRSRSPEASRALADACVDVLILVSLPQARWRLFAVPVRLSSELALQVHPALLDYIGWEHLGSRVSIFSILSAEATNEARELLIPSRLQARSNPLAELPEMDRSAILDLTGDNLADTAALCALRDLPLRLTGWDRLFLGDADWLTG
jgi:RNA polymerase Rpb1, domain 1